MRSMAWSDSALAKPSSAKLAGVVGTGGEAKLLLASEEVRVNGELESRRGRQLRAGDEVLVGDETLRVA